MTDKTPTDAQQYLNVAARCATTATSELAKNVLVDDGSGTLRELLNDAADAIRAGWGQPAPAQAQADSVQEDAARLDFLIEQRAYVVSDPDACPGYWLHWAMPDGRTWVQGDEHPTPRAAIDAGRKQGGARWPSAVRALTLHI